MKNRKHTSKYSVLGGVIAPSRSTYSIQGMTSPLIFNPRNMKPIDRSLPSMRFRGAVASLNNFNPYTRGLNKENFEAHREVYKRTYSKRGFTTDVQLHGKPAMSPVLSRNKKIW